MAITVKHLKVSTIPDTTDTDLVRPSDWNADHTLVGVGTMAEQDSNNVNITGGTVATTTLTTPTVSNYQNFTPTTAPSYVQGRVWYDSTEKALAFYNDSSALAVHVGQDLIFKVINNTGSTIANGSPVYITGTSSGQTYPNVALAKADVAATSAVIGLTNGAIANGAIGYVTSQGTIDNVNTSTFTVGQVLYLSPYSAGQLMNTLPPTGITVQVGVVTYVDSSAGHIYVKQTTPLAVPASIITGQVAVANGGTGASTASGARTNLGLGTISTQDANAVAITGGAIDGATVGATTPSTGKFTSIEDTGNLTFSGTGNRILGDFSNGTFANRVMFQTSTANSTTAISAIPSGTGTQSFFHAYNNSDPTNSSFAQMTASSSAVVFSSNIRGTGSYLPINFNVNGVQAVITATASPVNYINITGAATGTAPVVSALGSDTNISLVLQPKGTGALQAQKNDATATGGNARGANAVDWQTSRASASQVASGAYSVVCGGANNTASGAGSVICGGGTDGTNAFANTATAVIATVGGGFLNNSTGYGAVIIGGGQNTASGTYSNILGGVQGTTRGITGNTVMPACSTPIANTAGVSQGATLVLAVQTTDATATVLRSTNAAAGTTNQVILPNNSAYLFKATVISGVTGGGNTSAWKLEGAIKRGANAASTAIVGSVTTTLLAQDAGASTWAVTATADTTNGGLKITFTGQAGTTIRTVCKVETTEMTY